jgi:hypothetical protein
VGDGLAQQPPGLLEVGGPEDRADRRPDQLLEILRAVAEGVAEEVDGAALPGRAQDLGDRGLAALVGIGDDQLDARKTTTDQAAQELPPERPWVSATPTSRPITSRWPQASTP